MVSKKSKIALASIAFLGAVNASAEGSYQFGLNQPYQDYSSNGNKPLYVDVVTAGEVINVAYCGSGNQTTGTSGTGDSITVQIFAPGDEPAVDTPLANVTSLGNVECNDDFLTPLDPTTLFQFDTTASGTGSYVITIENNDNNDIDRLDIAVTPDANTWPNPTENDGRLWSYSWQFYTGSFGESLSTDADYYALVPGGRPNTNYVWRLDLNNFSGNQYTLVANDLGVDAPNSGYSVPSASNSVTEKFPMYLGYPSIADERPTAPPVLSDFKFIDDAGQDYAISPSTTSGVQDSGNFEFVSDVEGTYAITIDTNSDGVFGAGDKLLLGNMLIGMNTVPWDGTGPDGVTVLSTGRYRAQLQARLGEYHFIANDVETSGGTEDGLTIYLANSDGSITDTNVFWDDQTYLSGSSNLPDGALSSSPAGKHTWGDFTSSSIGNNAFIDTYVYGISSFYTATLAVVADDSLQTGADGILTVPANSATGDSIAIQVNDPDNNVLTGVAEQLTVIVTNGTTGEREQLLLDETGVNTGIFSRNLATTNSGTAGVDNDGNMAVQFGDVLTTSYSDQLDSTGASQTILDTTTITAGSADTGTSLIFENPGSIVANGAATSAITVQLRDVYGNNLGLSGGTIVLATDAGALSSVTDNGDGTYSATLTAGTTAQTATISGTLDGNPITDTASVVFTPGAASAATSLITANPASIFADGSSSAAVTVQLRDSNGNNLTTSGGTVALVTDAGTLSAVIDNGDGTYSATLTAGTIAQTATISGTLDGNPITDTASVEFAPGAASALTSIISAGPTSIVADGATTSTVVVQLRDGNGNNLTASGGTVALATDAGTLSAVTDNGDGTYSAILTSSVTAETATITATLDSTPVNGSASVVFTPGEASAITSQITASPSSIVADGVSTSTITVQLRDSNSNNLTESGGTVLLTTSAGAISGVVDNGDGTYTALLTSATQPALASIAGTLNSSSISSSAVVEMTLNPLNDDDGDGISNGEEGVEDADGDGVPGYADLDSDNDGLPDSVEGSVDSDSDGIPDYLDLDSDNDGLYDVVESGLQNPIDSDENGRIDSGFGINGWADSAETTADSGDIGFDVADADGDGIEDFRDLDSDNDGIFDVTEAEGSDDDVDGFIGSGALSVDVNGLAQPAGLRPVDTDGDGVADFRDLDSDNDSLLDVVEANGSDEDGDGLVGAGDESSNINGLGVPDGGGLIAVDTDSDGVEDQRDLDSDNDGIPDVVESGGNDEDGNGLVGVGDPAVRANGIPELGARAPVDTDDDGINNHRDTDSDNDGVFDILEAGGSDTNGDATVDNFTDNDGNGFDDGIAAASLPLPDSDADGTPDYRDSDDTDNDGIPDARDLDDDNDGIPDALEGDLMVDTDGDGLPDSRDLDSDNDGLADLYESGVRELIAPDLLDLDSNARIDDVGAGDTNGLADGIETALNSGSVDYNGGVPIDTDEDGVADFRDLDSDNDGIADVVENGNEDPDGNGQEGSGQPASVNANGLTMADPSRELDSDDDGVPNYLDLDGDGDSVSDYREAGGSDTDSDGLFDGFTDTNGNGWDDSLEGSPLSPGDLDRDGIPDFRDADDSDGDGIFDAVDQDDDNDGIPDELEGDLQVDTDGDGVPDSRDLDSDNDGIFDLAESGVDEVMAVSELDTNNDGRIDALGGSDTNGLADAVETAENSGVLIFNSGLTVDTDGDGTSDFRDLDSDGDGLNDVSENGGVDPDQDGIAGSGTPVVDANGLTSAATGEQLDSDNDGTPDYRQGGVIKTGLAGIGGCSISHNAPFDPTLPGLVLLSMLFISRRHVKHVLFGQQEIKQ